MIRVGEAVAVSDPNNDDGATMYAKVEAYYRFEVCKMERGSSKVLNNAKQILSDQSEMAILFQGDLLQYGRARRQIDP